MILEERRSAPRHFENIVKLLLLHLFTN